MITLPAVIHIVRSCAEHLITEDPYQYEDLTLDQISFAVGRGSRSPALFSEIRRKLKAQPPPEPEEQEILSKLLSFEPRPRKKKE